MGLSLPIILLNLRFGPKGMHSQDHLPQIIGVTSVLEVVLRVEEFLRHEALEVCVLADVIEGCYIGEVAVVFGDGAWVQVADF